ncbi:MAG TPA: hypothetical protein VFK27_06845, partial [Bacillales bacterium]|nr:hypothetical protein [Bacillales bacterium]
WSEDPVEYVANALSPSKVVRVKVNEEDKTTQVIVPDYQLSLAIGKRGQNARLAAKLTGWKIDIKSESEAEELGLLDEDEPEFFEGEADYEEYDDELEYDDEEYEDDEYYDDEYADDDEYEEDDEDDEYLEDDEVDEYDDDEYADEDEDEVNNPVDEKAK